jgi:hypothetical protein
MMMDRQENVGDLLADGLKVISQGHESIDSWLRRFPEFNEILRPPLEAAEWLHVRSPIFDPHPNFINTSRRSLVRQILVEQSLNSLSNGLNDIPFSEGEPSP